MTQARVSIRSVRLPLRAAVPLPYTPHSRHNPLPKEGAFVIFHSIQPGGPVGQRARSLQVLERVVCLG